MACFAAVTSIPEKAKFPHAARWFRHVGVLRNKLPHRDWSSAGASAAVGAKAKAKPKKAGMEYDVKPTPWPGDIHLTIKDPPALGMGEKNSTRKGGGQKGKYY